MSDEDEFTHLYCRSESEVEELNDRIAKLSERHEAQIREVTALVGSRNARIAELEKALREIRDYAQYHCNYSSIARHIFKIAGTTRL